MIITIIYNKKYNSDYKKKKKKKNLNLNLKNEKKKLF